MSFRKSIKRNQADTHFSYCVRARADWHCQRCEKDYTDLNRQGLQCSHFIGRGNWAIRYDPKNAISLCAGCHGFVEQHPVAHLNLWRDIHGGIHGTEKRDSELNALLARSTCKTRSQWARANHKTISKHYLAESKRIDEELKNHAEGKEADLELYRYVQR